MVCWPCSPRLDRDSGSGGAAPNHRRGIARREHHRTAAGCRPLPPRWPHRKQLSSSPARASRSTALSRSRALSKISPTMVVIAILNLRGTDMTFIPRFRDRSPAGFASAIFKLPGVLHNACIALGELEQRAALVYLRFSSRVCGGHTAKNGVFSHKAGESTKTSPRILCACVLYMPSTYFQNISLH